MINFENVLRSVPGYILDPAGTYEKNRDEGYSYAIATLVIPYAAIFILSGLLMAINDIFTGRPIYYAQFLFQSMGIYSLVIYSIQIPVIVFVIHCASKLENRNAKFIDSFKISLTGYTFYIFLIGVYTLINSLLIIFDMNTITLSLFIGYPFFILMLLLFVRVSAEGIKVLHGLSGLKSYAIAIIAASTAYFIIYLGNSWIMAIFQFINF